MKITYNKNPLCTTVELDEHEKKELWYKIKCNELVDLLFDAHFHLQDETKWFDLDKARKALEPKYYLEDEDENGIENLKSRLAADDWPSRAEGLNARVTMLQEHYIQELMGFHIGDCTCVPCSCSKCHAEGLLGINTLKGLGKHSAYKIDGAFGKNNERSIDEALESLKNYSTEPPADLTGWDKVGDWEKHVPRWTAEAKAAYEWLKQYNENFLCTRMEDEKDSN